jgi:plasmid stabilization system protein ParE
MADVIWTPQATAELEDILCYVRLTDGRPLTARRLAEQLLNKVDQYASGMSVGHTHSAAPSNWLYFQFKRGLVFYRDTSQGIEVMRVIDGARDLPEHLRPLVDEND